MNAFLQTIANAKDTTIRSTTGFGKYNEQQLRKLMERRGGVAVARVMNNIFQLGLAAAEDDNFDGFVRPTINIDLMRRVAQSTKIAPSPIADSDSESDSDSNEKDLLQALMQQMMQKRSQ